MPTYLSPGVFIQEVASGPTVIQGVATSSMGVVGYTAEGPTDTATLCTSFGGFQGVFGSFVAGSFVPVTVAAFFANSGSRAWVTRVVAADAALASVLVTNAGPVTIWTFDAISKGAWGNGLQVVIEGNADYVDYTTGQFTLFNVLINQLQSDGTYATQETYTAVSLTDATSPVYMPNVVNAGSSLVNVVAPLTNTIPTVLNGISETVSVGTGNGTQTTFTGTIPGGDLPAMPKTINITDGTQVVTDDGNGHLIGAVDPTGVNTIDYVGGAYSVKFAVAPLSAAPVVLTFFEVGAANATYNGSGGSDGVAGVTRNEVSNISLQAGRRGIYAFSRVDEILQLCVPDFAGDITVAGDQIAYCENSGNRFCILSTPVGMTPQQAVNYVKYTLVPNTSYAALYYPWVTISDPISGLATNMPPLGHVAGVYARTDNNKNVGKSPGGINDGVLNYAIGLEYVMDQGERDLVYPQRINPLIDTPTTGLAVWGVRTLSLDLSYRYINARRLLMFLEQSVKGSTNWVVFENNNSDTQGKVALQVKGFLLVLYGAGYFAGNTAAEAFFVQCDANNNPPEVVDAGQLICDIGVAPNKPAEFVIFRFKQQVASA